MLVWTSVWATDYRGQWVDTLTLLVTAVEVPSDVRSQPSTRSAVAVGALGVSVLPSGNLTSLDGTSAASNASAMVTAGSWGEVVCNGGVVVYSHTALAVAFEPPANAGYVPASYNIQVATTPDFPVNATHTRVVSPASSETTAVALPPPLPLSALRYVVTGLATGTPHHVRVSVAPPTLSNEVLLPRALPSVYRWGKARKEG